MHLEAFPSSLDADREFKHREDPRINALTYVLAGQARLRWRDNGTSVELLPGHVFQYNNQTIDDLALEPCPGFTECSVSVDGTTGKALEDLEIWQGDVRHAVIGLHASICRAYLALFDSILVQTKTPRALLGQLTGVLDAVYAFAGREDPDEQFKSSACSVLSANLSPRFSMRDAAHATGVGYDMFRRRFRALLGMAPIEYQLRKRMEQACMLLEHHGVKQTALMLDYSDPFVFSRQFTKYLGISPSGYRQSRQSGA